MTANETYSEAKRQFSIRNRDVLMNAQAAVFGSSSALPSLGGEMVDWYASLLVRLM